MKRSTQRPLNLLRRPKKWQVASAIALFLLKKWQVASAITFLLLVLGIWGINKTKFLAGYWGIFNDEIAVVTIEAGERETDGSEKITVVSPNKSIWDGLELLGVPLVLAVLGAWFQKTQQAQAERIAKKQREQDLDESREEVLQLYLDRISNLLIDKNLMVLAAKRDIAFATAAVAAEAVTEAKAVNEANVEAVTEARLSGISAVAAAVAAVRAAYNETERLPIFPGSKDEDLDKAIEAAKAKPTAEAEVMVSKAKVMAEESATAVTSAEAKSVAAALFAEELKELLEVGRDVIQARTLSILRGFKDDAERKSSVVRFLVEAEVISRLNIKLSEANLNEVNLSGADLRGVSLDGATLLKANLNGTDLREADLRGADLSEAKVSSTKFGIGKGLSEVEKADLKRRGAIFEDGTPNPDQDTTPNPI